MDTFRFAYPTCYLRSGMTDTSVKKPDADMSDTQRSTANDAAAKGSPDKSHADVERLSFERAIEELETIVKRLEDGKVPLEESVAIYERGEALKRRCEELLRQAEARVEKITLDASGKPAGTEPLDVT